MSRPTKASSLADIKNILNPPAKTAQRPTLQPKKQTSLSIPSPEDEQQAFKQAIAGTKAIRPNNQAQLNIPAPPPVPRPKTPEQKETLSSPRHNTLNLPESWFDPPEILSSEPEARLLTVALQGVIPLQTDKIYPELPKPPPEPLQHQQDEESALFETLYAPTPLEFRLEGGDELTYLRESLPRSVLKDLRRGRWVVQAQLDLHGATRDDARELLATFLAQCRKKQIRCVRVIHGKGLGSPKKEPVLKKLVAGWLMNYDNVMAYTQAPSHDGGSGALLLLLKGERPHSSF